MRIAFAMGGCRVCVEYVWSVVRGGWCVVRERVDGRRPRNRGGPLRMIPAGRWRRRRATVQRDEAERAELSSARGRAGQAGQRVLCES